MSRIEEALRRANRDIAPPVSLQEDVDYRPEEIGSSASSAGLPLDASLVQPQSVQSGLLEDRTNLSDKLIVTQTAAPHAVEQYRKLAATLYQIEVERGTRVVMVSSAAPGEGKSLTASNLALTISESFRRNVLLVDADLRRPSIHEMFGIPNTSGLNDGLKAGKDAKLRLVEVSPHLTVLPAGPPTSDPMSGLTSDRMRRIVEEASAKFEWVVLDTPPVGLLPDANLLSEMVDMIVLVIGAGTTPYRQVQRAVDALDRNRIVGVVLNRVTEAEEVRQYYGYYAASARRA